MRLFRRELTSKSIPAVAQSPDVKKFFACHWSPSTLRLLDTPAGKARQSAADDFTTGAQFRKDLDSDYANMKAVLVELGFAKQ